MPLFPRDVKEFLAPFKILSNKNAMSAMYKSLELAPDYVRGCSKYGILEVVMKLGIDEVMHVNAATFIAVIDSLPAEEDLELANVDGVLLWACGSAKGKIALMAVEAMPEITRRNRPDGWPVTAGFAEGLRLGAISCDSASLASVGMHGVIIDNRGSLSIRTSDNITVSSCEVGGKIPAAPEVITIDPEAAGLLASIITKDGILEFDAISVYYRDAGCKLLLKQVASLKHDLAKIMRNFEKQELVAEIPRDRITSFIKRTAALSESKKGVYVTLHAESGQLALSFSEAQAGSDEYYLVDGLQIPDGLEIKIEASKLARALAHVEEVVLDHVDKGAVIFRGKSPAYTYMVSGSV